MDDKEKKLALIEAICDLWGAENTTYDVLRESGITHGEMEEAGLDLREHYMFEYDEINLLNKRMQRGVNRLFNMVQDGLKHGDRDVEVDMENFMELNIDLPLRDNLYLQELFANMVYDRGRWEKLDLDWQDDLCLFRPEEPGPERRTTMNCDDLWRHIAEEHREFLADLYRQWQEEPALTDHYFTLIHKRLPMATGLTDWFELTLQADDGMVELGFRRQGGEPILEGTLTGRGQKPVSLSMLGPGASSTAGDYSPSSPWNAPGMSMKDFI